MDGVLTDYVFFDFVFIIDFAGFYRHTHAV